MKLKPLQLALLVLVLLVLLAGTGAAALADDGSSDDSEDDAAGGSEFDVSSDDTDNGPLVGPPTTVGADGIIRVDPYELADAAGLDAETYALARCLASEHPRDSNAYLVAVGWATKNKAREKGVDLVELLTNGRGDAGDGYFGQQKASAGTKYAATGQDPHQRHVDAAAAVVDETVPDPTDGATHFFSPEAQDSLAARAAAGEDRFRKYLGHDAAFIFASWAAPGGLYPQGAVPVVPPGIDGRRLTLWRAA